MADDRTTRRLTTIVAADIAGYSRLMGADEEGTLAALRAHRAELIEPEINNHGGRIANTAGDSFLLEFPSVVDALRCVMAIQAGMARRDRDVPTDRRIEFRVGINVGDVMAEGEDLFGDGVNIAARIEGLAEPGGICLSRTARDNVRDRMDIDLEDLGEVEVKNIARPVRVFRVLGEGEIAKAPVGAAWRKYAVAAAVIAAIVVAGGVWSWLQPDFQPADPSRLAFALPDKPSIAVLPFDNMTGDADRQFLADGFVEQLITQLSRNPDIMVIARGSSFSYRGKGAPIRQISEELGVRYVIEGSLQQAGERIRINVQLVDGIKGFHIWSKAYDRSSIDFFDLQDEIITAISYELLGRRGEIIAAENRRNRTKRNSDISVFQLGEKSTAEWLKKTKEANQRSREMNEEMLRRDPDSARAHAFMAWVEIANSSYGWVEDTDAAIKRACTWAEKAIQLDPGEYQGHFAAAYCYKDSGREAEKRAALEKVLILNPGAPYTVMSYANEVLLPDGRVDEAIAKYKAIARTNPRSRIMTIVNRVLGYAYFHKERYDLAAEYLLKAKSKALASRATLAAAYHLAGRGAEAKSLATTLRAEKPKFAAGDFIKSLGPSRKDMSEAVIAALVELGIPKKFAVSPKKPSLAVLPFDNLSGDAKQDFFADGFTDSLIAAVSKISELFVIARNSTFTYKGKAVKAQRIAEELGVRYIVEGSIQRAGQRIRVTAQLIDGKTGEHLWAEKYDRDLDDTFALQDEIIQKIATEMRVKLTEGEYARSSFYVCKNSIEATELAWKASDALRRFTKEDNVLVRRLSEQAIKLAPECVGAWFVLSLGYFLEAAYGWSEDPAADLKKSAEIVDRALSIDDKFPDLYLVQAQIETASGAHDKAVAYAEKALKLDPNHTMNLAVAAGVYNRSSLPEKGLAAIKKAIRRSPRDLSWYPAELLRSLVFIGKFDEVISVGEAYVKSEAGFYTTKAHEQLAYAYGELGRTDKAKAHIATILKRQPEYTVTTIKPIDLSQYKDTAFVERYYDRLQALGLPK